MYDIGRSQIDVCFPPKQSFDQAKIVEIERQLTATSGLWCVGLLARNIWSESLFAEFKPACLTFSSSLAQMKGVIHLTGPRNIVKNMPAAGFSTSAPKYGPNAGITSHPKNKDEKVNKTPNDASPRLPSKRHQVESKRSNSASI